MSADWILVFLAALSGFYMAFSIGANDVANAVGTAVGAGSLKLRHAVILAGIFEFLGAWLLGTEVTTTIQKGLIEASAFEGQEWTLALGMVSCLLATGVWLQLASYWGWPVSTTHSIVGAVVGFACAAVGYHAVQFSTLAKIASSWVLSPLVGCVVAYGIFVLLRQRVFYDERPLLKLYRIGPILASLMVVLLVSITTIPNLSCMNAQQKGAVVLVSLFLALVGYFGVRKWIARLMTRSSEYKDFHPHYIEGKIVEGNFQRAIAHLEEIKALANEEQMELIKKRIYELKALSTQVGRPSHAKELNLVERVFSRFQVVSACFMALSHGANDVSNAVGPLTAALKAIPIAAFIKMSWLLIVGGMGIVLGLAIWGWRVIETVGKKITALTPSRGFCAELGCASTVLICSQLGLPVSTTHTLVGAILGVGLARGLSALNLQTMRDIVASWIITIPAGALFAWAVFHIITQFM